MRKVGDEIDLGYRYLIVIPFGVLAIVVVWAVGNLWLISSGGGQ